MKIQKTFGVCLLAVMILTGLCTIASAVDQKGTVTGRVDTVIAFRISNVTTVTN
jgi:hypothetical protein